MSDDDEWIEHFRRVTHPPEVDDMRKLRDVFVSIGFTTPSMMLGSSENLLLQLTADHELSCTLRTFAVRALRNLEAASVRQQVVATSAAAPLTAAEALLETHSNAPRRTSSNVGKLALPGTVFYVHTQL